PRQRLRQRHRGGVVGGDRRRRQGSRLRLLGVVGALGEQRQHEEGGQQAQTDQSDRPPSPRWGIPSLISPHPGAVLTDPPPTPQPPICSRLLDRNPLYLEQTERIQFCPESQEISPGIALLGGLPQQVRRVVERHQRNRAA